MDVSYLHTGEPVLVLEEGSGEPGTWAGTGANAQWTANPDYVPAKIVRLGAIEDAEQGQIVGSLAETSTVARDEAIARGELGARHTDVQFVHDPQALDTPAVPGGSPVVGAPVEGSPEEELTEGALNDADRAELEQLRHEAAQRQAADADPTRDTTTTP